VAVLVMVVISTTEVYLEVTSTVLHQLAPCVQEGGYTGCAPG